MKCEECRKTVTVTAPLALTVGQRVSISLEAYPIYFELGYNYEQGRKARMTLCPACYQKYLDKATEALRKYCVEEEKLLEEEKKKRIMLLEKELNELKGVAK